MGFILGTVTVYGAADGILICGRVREIEQEMAHFVGDTYDESAASILAITAV